MRALAAVVVVRRAEMKPYHSQFTHITVAALVAA
jgi:hypothetical protein